MGSWAWWFMTDKWLWAAFLGKTGLGYILHRVRRDLYDAPEVVNETELEEQAIPLQQWLEEAILADSVSDGYHLPVMVDAVPLSEEAMVALAAF